LIPAILCLGTLAVARRRYPVPRELEARVPQLPTIQGLSKNYWTYILAGACIATGFADFSLIAFHFQRAQTVTESLIPVYYAVAMATGAIAALLFGKLFDRLGSPILLFAFLVPALSSPCLFFGNASLALVGMVLWGMGLGAQDSLLKATLAAVITPERRGTGFGFFDTVFGIAWFIGSVVMGLLYDRTRLGLVLFSVFFQLAALPLFFLARRGRIVERRLPNRRTEGC
jgi:predicted MFS family arabinose efflux permease